VFKAFLNSVNLFYQFQELLPLSAFVTFKRIDDVKFGFRFSDISGDFYDSARDTTLPVDEAFLTRGT